MNDLYRTLRCQCGGRCAGLCRMPPAPSVISALYMDYLRERVPGMTFAQYLASIGFTDPSVTTEGMDDRAIALPSAGGGLALIQKPRIEVQGKLNVIVLLVDFADRQGYMKPGHYEDLLFSRDVHPTGSLADFYHEASNGKVAVTGTVHGWLRMPQTYAYYVGKGWGTKGAYPNNCARLAEDAAHAALEQGIVFAPELDKLRQGVVTAFFLVHAGRGAEYIQDGQASLREIWSHKWAVRSPVQVAPDGMAVTTYLTVPQDCTMGVCAHELGHLAFQWQDFYDPNYDEDGFFWQGSGDWDLMASGSHNHDGAIPAHPAGLHKVQHRWVQVEEITASVDHIVLRPSSHAGGRVLKVVSPVFAPGQYLILEARVRTAFDRHIPGEGLLVWRVDEAQEMEAPATPGMQLVQADGLQQLESPTARNQGDDSDPFPGTKGVTSVGDSGKASTSFPGGPRSGIRLSNIAVDASGAVSLSIHIG